MSKLIRKHQFITAPNSQGLSYFGLTQFAKDYFLRFGSITHESYPKTQYGLWFPTRISRFLVQTQSLHNLAPTQVHSQLSDLSLSEQIEYRRFCLEQDEPFSLLKTVQFDVQLSAPVGMRVIRSNFQAFYDCDIYRADWLYEVQVLDWQTYEDKVGLLTEEQYQREAKIIEYDGMLL